MPARIRPNETLNYASPSPLRPAANTAMIAGGEREGANSSSAARKDCGENAKARKGESAKGKGMLLIRKPGKHGYLSPGFRISSSIHPDFRFFALSRSLRILSRRIRAGGPASDTAGSRGRRSATTRGGKG